MIKRSLCKGVVSLAVVAALGYGAVVQAADTGGFSNTTGGDSYTATTVTTLAQLKAAVAAGSHHIIVSGTIYGGSTLTTLTFASVGQAPLVQPLTLRTP